MRLEITHTTTREVFSECYPTGFRFLPPASVTDCYLFTLVYDDGKRSDVEMVSMEKLEARMRDWRFVNPDIPVLLITDAARMVNAIAA